MKELMEALTSVIDLCNTRIKKADEAKHSAAEREKEAVAIKEAYSAKISDLESREKRLAAEELAGQTLGEAREIFKQNKDREDYLKSEMAKIEVVKDEIAKKEKNFEVSKKSTEDKLRAMAEKLDADRKKYKQEVLNEIDKEQKLKGNK